MRIVYASDSSFPSQSANSVHVIRMCEALVTEGHMVTLTGIRRPGHSDEDICQFYGIEKSINFSLYSGLIFKGLLLLTAVINALTIRRVRPDLLVGRSYFTLALSTVLSPRVPLVFETHSPVRLMTWLQRLAFRRLTLCSRFIVVISEALRKILEEETEGRFKFMVLHDGSKLRCVLQHRTPSVRLRLGYAGTIQKGRGVEQIIALSRLLPEMDFYIAGGSTASICEKLGVTDLPDNLICRGFIPPSEVISFHQGMDVLLAPYQTDTSVRSGANTSSYMSPLKIFEYMASGVPIIASDLPVIREVLNEENAILVNPGDIASWKEAIEKMKDQIVRCSLAERALHDLRENFTWSVRVKKIINNIEHFNLT